MPNVLSPRDLVSRPDNMDETVLSSSYRFTRTEDLSGHSVEIHVFGSHSG